MQNENVQTEYPENATFATAHKAPYYEIA